MPGSTCDVCGKPSIGVCASAAGAISCAYCEECINAGREPWSVLVGGLMGVTETTIHPDFQPVIDATCQFYGKTVKEFWAAVDQASNEYMEYCRKQAEAEAASPEFCPHGHDALEAGRGLCERCNRESKTPAS